MKNNQNENQELMDMVELDDADLESVAGGYPDSVSENLCSDVIRYIEQNAAFLKAEGFDRDDCGRTLYEDRTKLYLMNEDNGKDYFIDWAYVNLMLDEIYGI